MTRAVCVLLAIALLTTTAVAVAHSSYLSYSFWTATPDGADVAVQLTTSDLALLGFDLDAEPASATDAARHVQRLVTMKTGGAPCEPFDLPERVMSRSPWVLWRWSLRCPTHGARVVSVGFDAAFAAGQRHLLRWDDGSGSAVEHLLDATNTSCTLGNANRSAAGSSFIDYVGLGVEHLLTGWDHVVFVLALLLLATRVREVVALVTSFTVAHSVTLALSVLGVVKPDPAPVEALIGFSIALLGVENAWLLAGRGLRIPALVITALAATLVAGGGSVGRVGLLGLVVFSACHFALMKRAHAPGPLRVAIAFAFGLIHGFGFAGVMAELRLPVARLVPALLGFNVGVELGQLGVVLVTWPLLLALARARNGRWHAPALELASAAVSTVGVFWFVARLFE